jgi:hypothetical protein
MIIFIHSIPINILLRTTNRTAYRSSIPPDVPNSSQVAYRVPVPVPRTKANYELCDYVHNITTYKEYVNENEQSQNLMDSP